MKTYEQLSNAVLGGTPATSGKGKDKTSTNSTPLCRFYFQNGHCRYESSCRFSHEPPREGMTREEILGMIPCPHFERGICNFGDDCELLHQRYDQQEGQCQVIKSNNEKKDGEVCIDTTCGICLENVYDTQQKQFGLLSGCFHIFCHSCLMQWRSRSETSATLRRVCPTCREPSNYVIPSKVFPSTPSQKEMIVQRYKNKCSKIPCRKFVSGRLGSCPFGRDCFYAHHDENGVDMKERDKSMDELFEERERGRNRRRRRNGNNQDASDLDLITEMLMMMALQRGMNGGGGGSRRQRDDDEEGIGIDVGDMLFEMLSETGFPFPMEMHQFFAAMNALDDDEYESSDQDSDDGSSNDSMPALEDRNLNDSDEDEDSMPPLEDFDETSSGESDSDEDSMPPLAGIE